MANNADPDLKKPTDLNLHCLQRQGKSGSSGTTVKIQEPIHMQVKVWSKWVQYQLDSD